MGNAIGKYQLANGRLMVIQDGADFYNAATGDILWSALHGVRGDHDLEGAKACRKEFIEQHPTYTIKWC